MSEFKIVTFKMGSEELAVEIGEAEEVIRQQQVTRVPRSPSYVMGVINFRGEILPVIDLGERFGMEAVESGKGGSGKGGSGKGENGKGENGEGEGQFLIIRIRDTRLGLWVGHVERILTVDEGDLQPAPEVDKGIGGEYMRGVVWVDDQLIIILDLESMLENTARKAG